MNPEELCSMLGGPLPLGDEKARLADRYWMIRDVIESDDEMEPPAKLYDDVLGADFDALGWAYDSVQRGQAYVIETLHKAHSDYVRSRDAVLADTPDARASRISDDQAMERSFASQVAVHLGVTDRSAVAMIHEADTLVDDLPQLMDALRVGFISYLHARTAAQQAWSIPKEARAEFDAQLVGKARTQSPTRFRQTARKLRERLHPESIQTRKNTAFENRQVEFVADEDGMAWTNLYHSADVTQSIYEQTRTQARPLKAAGDERTLQQIEADIFAETHLANTTAHAGAASSGGSTPASSTPTAAATDRASAGDGSAEDEASAEPSVETPSSDTVTITRAQLAALRPGIVITVPALTLLGQSTEPADLAGYGPIDPKTAATLLGAARSFTRVLTDPITGTQQIVDPHKYRLSEQLKRDIRLRDTTCGFPHCDTPAWRCDIDHITPWHAGGKSTPASLIAVCRRHHVLKHATNWTVKRLPDGTLEWTSPTGTKHIVTRE